MLIKVIFTNKRVKNTSGRKLYSFLINDNDPNRVDIGDLINCSNYSKPLQVVEIEKTYNKSEYEGINLKTLNLSKVKKEDEEGMFVYENLNFKYDKPDFVSL